MICLVRGRFSHSQAHRLSIWGFNRFCVQRNNRRTVHRSRLPYSRNVCNSVPLVSVSSLIKHTACLHFRWCKGVHGTMGILRRTDLLQAVKRVLIKNQGKFQGSKYKILWINQECFRLTKLGNIKTFKLTQLCSFGKIESDIECHSCMKECLPGVQCASCCSL